MDTDYKGRNIGNVHGQNATHCCRLCGVYNGCLYFSFAHGTCYFKDKVTSTITNPGVVSGTRGNSTVWILIDEN